MKISEMFLGLQGEGIESGLPTFFIRTAGCNLRCSWCDTKYAYNGKNIEILQIVKECEKSGVKRICLTGGEPLLQKEECIKLLRILIKKGFKISIETNGSINISDLPKKAIISLDIKCPSSGEHDKIFYKNLKLIRKSDQVKFIIADEKDYKFAKKIIKKFNLENKTNVILQPEFNNEFDKRLIKNVLRDKINIRLSFQLHKICWNDYPN